MFSARFLNGAVDMNLMAYQGSDVKCIDRKTFDNLKTSKKTLDVLIIQQSQNRERCWQNFSDLLQQNGP